MYIIFQCHVLWRKIKKVGDEKCWDGSIGGQGQIVIYNWVAREGDI